MHAYVGTYVRTYVHTNMHAQIHTHRRVYIYICIIYIAFGNACSAYSTSFYCIFMFRFGNLKGFACPNGLSGQKDAAQLRVQQSHQCMWKEQ